ncbi:MAG TPA: OsmC family protein [Gemmatimonadaceae bacterium]
MTTNIREYDIGARTTDTLGRVLCEARNHHFIIDGPVQNGCPGEELTPPEIFLAAVASCGVELVQVIARDQGVPVGPFRVKAHGLVDRSRQPREDVTLFNSVRLDFAFSGTDGAAAAALVEAFKRR